jgi:hypothetical protein
MPIRVRVNLVNGSTHRILVEEDDPATVLEKLRMNAAPFSAEWIETIDGEIVRISTIASLGVDHDDTDA